jgi:hypothetical protein
VEIELDAKLAVNLSNNSSVSTNPNATNVADCRENLRRIPRARINHYHREGKKKKVLMLWLEEELANSNILGFFADPRLDVSFLLNLDISNMLYECLLCDNNVDV